MIEDQIKGLTRARVISQVRELRDEVETLMEAANVLFSTARDLKDHDNNEEGTRYLLEREADSLEDTAGRLDDEASEKSDLLQNLWELFALTHEEVYPDGN